MYDIPLSNISLAQIQHFIKTVEFNSFTKAARHLHVTQSAISKTVATLENTLKIQLFIRNTQKLQLTPAGRQLYEKWHIIIKQLEDSVEQAHEIQKGYSYSLNFGVLDSQRPDAVVFPVVKVFQEKYPDVKIRLATNSATELEKLLLAGELDCIFTVLYNVAGNEAKPYEYKVVKECPLEVCMLRSNPLAEKEMLKVNDLKSYNFICVSPLNLPRYFEMIKELCEPSGFKPHISCYTEEANTLPLNLITNTDIFICDQYFRDYHTRCFSFKPLENTKSGIALCWNKDENRRQVKQFIEAVCQN